MQRRKVTNMLYLSVLQSYGLLALLRSHKDLWNAALEKRIDAWRKAGKSISYENQCRSLSQARGELPKAWVTQNCSSQQEGAIGDGPRPLCRRRERCAPRQTRLVRSA